MSSRHARRISTPLPYLGKLTLSAGVITDVTRLAGVGGDGEAYPDSSAGVWPAATNLCANGGAETNNTGWTTGGVNPNPERSADRAKFGSYSFKCGGGAGISLASYAITYAGAGTYTCSARVYIPSDWDGGYLSLSDAGLYAGSTTGGSNTVSTVGSWQKLYFTHTVVAGDLAGAMRLYTSGGSASSKYVYMDGFQVESGSIATPYIETDGGTASRVAGDCYATTFSSLVNPTKGWMFVRGRFGVSDAAAPAGAYGLAECGRADGTSRVTLTWTPAMNQLNVARVGGGSSGSLGGSPAITPALGDYVTAGMGWSASLIGTATNGNAFNTQADTNIGGAFDRITFGSRRAGSSPFYGDILWAVIGSEDTWDTALSVLMDSFGNNDPLPHQIPRRYGPVVLATMNGDGTMYRYAA